MARLDTELQALDELVFESRCAFASVVDDLGRVEYTRKPPALKRAVAFARI
jgi:hypothetical protein